MLLLAVAAVVQVVLAIPQPMGQLVALVVEQVPDLLAAIHFHILVLRVIL
jgi:hypothetical protein